MEAACIKTVLPISSAIFFYFFFYIWNTCWLQWSQSRTGSCHAYSASSDMLHSPRHDFGWQIFQGKNCLGQQKPAKTCQSVRGRSIWKECWQLGSNHGRKSRDKRMQCMPDHLLLSAWQSVYGFDFTGPNLTSQSLIVLRCITFPQKIYITSWYSSQSIRNATSMQYRQHNFFQHFFFATSIMLHGTLYVLIVFPSCLSFTLLTPVLSLSPFLSHTHAHTHTFMRATTHTHTVI